MAEQQPVDIDPKTGTYIARGGLLLTGLILSAARHGLDESVLSTVRVAGDAIQGAVYLKTAFDIARYAVNSRRAGHDNADGE